jgi:hypothetical protein
MTTPETKTGPSITFVAWLAALFSTVPAAAAVRSMAACRKYFRFDVSA